MKFELTDRSREFIMIFVMISLYAGCQSAERPSNDARARSQPAHTRLESELIDLERSRHASGTVTLDGDDLEILDFADSSFAKTDLSLLDLRNSSFRGTSFTEVNLSDSLLNCSNLSGAAFSGATLTRADLSNTNLEYAIFSNVKGTLMNLSGARMKFLKMTNSDMRGSRLTDVAILGADLSNTNLEDADFSNSHLVSSVLTGANLRRARLEHTVCLGVEWTGAICPDGRVATLEAGCRCGYESFEEGLTTPRDGWADCSVGTVP